MPRAEAGSLKSLNNKMKAKGLQRLRWYCQVCEKQCRDENGFKCHTQSESHVRQMLVIGDNAKQFIADYSGQFQRDFVQLLRTGHGEKKINANHFYQEYIANKEHVHMNATRWISLSEFVKHLGREGVCRVEEGEKGLFVSWVDSSPEAMQRQEAVRRKERQDRGDEEREQRAIREQVERARRDAEGAGRDVAAEEEERVLRRGEEGERIKLSFGARRVVPVEQPAGKGGEDEPEKVTEYTTAAATSEEAHPPPPPPPPPPKVSLKMAAAGKPKNVFAAKKKDAKKETKKKEAAAPERPMSTAERIMREDMARKRLRGGPGPGPGPEGSRDTKRQRV